jgi:predicted phosphodiesterase
MRTLIVSDLHLGGLSGVDLLRHAELRAPLLQELRDVDRLVLLGDVLELRHGPPHEALAAARPFFEDVGRVLADGELVVTAGNHDHLLVSCWLDARALHEPEPLRLEQRFAAAEGSAMLEQIAEWAAPARVSAAYPGLWVRPDVYATHGHYLDCHLTIPTLERLGVGAMGRLLERPVAALDTVDGYEAVTAPIYAWRDAMARYARTGPALNGLATTRAWRALGGGDTANGAAAPRRGVGRRLQLARSSLRRRAVLGAFPVAVAALDRAGLGPLSANISREELRRAGLGAMGAVAARLGLGDAYVVFGHTHRPGPLPGDDAREWRGAGIAATAAPGARLVNTGSWIYDSSFVSGPPAGSPYWPGTCVLVEDAGPPLLKRLLLDRSHVELAPAKPSRA